MSARTYRHVRAWLDREQSDPLQGGGRPQDACLLLTDRPDERARQPAAVAMLACQARDLAFELLVLAEEAARQRTPAGA